jgi:hypothetical protein
MRDNEPQPKPEPPRPERLMEEGRSASAVALGFLNDVKTGAGWTTGAVIVGGAAKKVQEVFSNKGDAPKDAPPPPERPKASGEAEG